jgi:hypothetical protein
MRKLLVVSALASATVASTMIASTDEAQAQRRWGRALGFGIAAGVLTGVAIANSGPVYVEGATCRYVAQYDQWGNYVGRVQVCNTNPY